MKLRWTPILIGLILWHCAWAQDPPTPMATASPTASAVPGVTASDIPAAAFAIGDIAAKLDTTQSAIDEVNSALASDTTLVDVDKPLSALSMEVTQRSLALSQRLSGNLSLGELRDLEREWADRAASLPDWKRRLNQRNQELGAEIDRLATLYDSWSATLVADDSKQLPTELLDRIRETVTQLDTVRNRATRSQASLLVMLTRLSSVDAKVQETLAQLSQARQEQVGKILVHDAEPLWRADLSKLRITSLSRDTLASLQAQWRTLSDYATHNGERFLEHFLCLGLIYFGLRWARTRVTPWAEQEPTLQRPADIFNTPLATGILLTVLLGGWFYPQPPAVLQAMLAAAALFPAVAVLKRLLGQHLHSTLYMLILLFVVDQVRAITAPQVLLSRLIFTAEIVVVLVYLLYRIVHYRNLELFAQRGRLLVTALFGFSLVADILGFLGLAYTTGDAALHCTYLAVFLYSMVQISYGLIMLCLRTPPLSLLASVKGHEESYCIRLHRWVRYLALLFWTLRSLDYLGIRQSVLDTLSGSLGWGLHVGAVHMTLGGVLGLALALAIPYQLSRFLRFALEQDVYPRLQVSRGATYTLSTVIHYLLLVSGALFGMAAVGIDMTQFTIVASALGVGIGFGLQNIVNNFVSGMILLFERPVEVGHVVDVSGQLGRLTRIGLRASVIRTADGSEVIIPNGELLSTRVTNWTLTDQRRLLRVKVGVDYGSKVSQVKEVLQTMAAAHPRIQKEPAPEAIFLDLGESSLDFELRAWTADFDCWVQTRSDLVTGVYESLTEAGIGIPFPQRTLHLENYPPAPPAPREEPDDKP